MPKAKNLVSHVGPHVADHAGETDHIVTPIGSFRDLHTIPMQPQRYQIMLRHGFGRVASHLGVGCRHILPESSGWAWGFADDVLLEE